MHKDELIFGAFSVGQAPYRELLLSEWLYEKVQLTKAECSFVKQKSAKLWCGLVLLQPIWATVCHTFKKRPFNSCLLKKNNKQTKKNQNEKPILR